METLIINPWYNLDDEDIGLAPDDPTVVTDDSGYVPTEVQIFNLMQAGVNLDNYYAENYPGELSSNQYNDTMPYGYDYFDAHSDVTLVRSTLNAKPDQTIPQAVADYLAAHYTPPTQAVPATAPPPATVDPPPTPPPATS